MTIAVGDIVGYFALDGDRAPAIVTRVHSAISGEEVATLTVFPVANLPFYMVEVKRGLDRGQFCLIRGE